MFLHCEEPKIPEPHFMILVLKRVDPILRQYLGYFPKELSHGARKR